ncbi:hypothetical protein LOCC1_G005665 [Lachnellula occidentalis]|uniref:Heterokaryon incompatibility domain-containing protein n=1 Tax=Lachnellula occidentalis TaxID=215460 RepID=A0A8H8S8I5_9HELO|nr:hypothetical protein LOCC1_G005665 [Lachnellula occidentalis]
MRSVPTCDVCLGLKWSFNNKGWRMYNREDHSAEFSRPFQVYQLNLSAQRGCRNCAIIRNGIEVMSRELSLFDTSYVFKGRIIWQNRDPQWAAFGCAKDVPSKNSAVQCAPLVLKWVKNCYENHIHCGGSIVGEDNKMFLPSRVLDVKPNTGGVVRLVETRDIDVSSNCPQYASLSHCWGKKSFLITTQKTLEQRKQGIEWDTLPRTFQDAITLVQALGIRFIWIDSLCIIQGDTEDWRKEAACMARIYSNSYLNIAATGASDSRGGCFFPRSLKDSSWPSELKSFPVGSHIDGSGPVIRVRPSLNAVHLRFSTTTSTLSYNFDTAAVPLLSRAWVFQERYLAPRTLHFHPTEMVLECKSTIRCECTGLDKLVSPMRKNSLDLRSLGKREVLNYWFEVVQEYSFLRLTRQSDRLIALIGVATVFHERLQSGYLAGLWEEDIARNLLWKVSKFEWTRHHRNTRRPKQALIPSWSWASLVLETPGRGILFMADCDDSFAVDPHFKHLGTSIPLSPIYSYVGVDSKVTNGKLFLQGFSSSALICRNAQMTSDSKDALLILERDLDNFVLISAVKIDLDVPWNKACTDSGTVVYCLLVGSSLWESCNPKSNENGSSMEKLEIKYQCSLVLKPSIRIETAFERIGVLEVEEECGVFIETTDKAFEVV